MHMQMQDLRFGVIGWGYWGPKIARNLDTLLHTSVAMVADADIKRLSTLSLNQPWIKTTTEAADVFNSDVDAVVVVTPVRTHYQLARQALLHGKHVLVEKPLTNNVEEAEELELAVDEEEAVEVLDDGDVELPVSDCSALWTADARAVVTRVKAV